MPVNDTAIPCIICDRPTKSVCGDWCDECAGQPMCIGCQNEHAEDVAFDVSAGDSGGSVR